MIMADAAWWWLCTRQPC